MLCCWCIFLELAATCEERDRLKYKLLETTTALAENKQQKREVEMSRGDLLDAYKIVLQEKRKLEMDNQSLRWVK